MARFKCPEEDYALLQRLRNQLISLKIDYRGLEESHEYSLKAKRFEVADFLSGIMKRRLDEIRGLEKEISSLESECFVEGKQAFTENEKATKKPDASAYEPQ